MKKNWYKEKDKFNKKLNSIFFVIYFKKKRCIYMKKNWNKENISLINYFKKTQRKPSSGPNLIAKTTMYIICCFKNVGVPGTSHRNIGKPNNLSVWEQ
jgi:hypothetical protein